MVDTNRVQEILHDAAAMDSRRVAALKNQRLVIERLHNLIALAEEFIDTRSLSLEWESKKAEFYAGMEPSPGVEGASG